MIEKNKENNYYSVVHGSFLALMVAGLLWFTLESRDLHYLIKYFSLQGYWLATFYSFTSMLTRTRQSRINQILHELALTSNIIVSLGYWFVARAPVVDKISSSFLLCNDLIHTIPILMLILISYQQNLQYFEMKNIKYQIIFMVFAFSVNIFYTFWEGPVYVFMTYEDIGTAIFLVGGFIVLLANFVIMNKITKFRQSNKSKVQ